MPADVVFAELCEVRSERSGGKPVIDLVLHRPRLLAHFAPNLFVAVMRDNIFGAVSYSQSHNEDANTSDYLASPRHQRIVTVFDVSQR
jgi:hypothetical protein